MLRTVLVCSIYLAALLLLASAEELPPIERFYIYDWPDVISRLQSLQLDRGAGKPFHNGNGSGVTGLYDTDQFSLFRLMYHRMLRDPRRTRNPNEASSFFIPYDAYFDAHNKVDAEGNLVWDYYGTSALAPKITERLKGSSYFQKSKGKDHFMILNYCSTSEYAYLTNSSVPFYELCENCTKLTIEDYSFLKLPYRNLQMQQRGNNW